MSSNATKNIIKRTDLEIKQDAWPADCPPWDSRRNKTCIWEISNGKHPEHFYGPLPDPTFSPEFGKSE